MPRKKPKLVAWEIIQIGTSGRLLGVVHAANEADALETAIVQFDIRRPDCRSETQQTMMAGPCSYPASVARTRMASSPMK